MKTKITYLSYKYNVKNKYEEITLLVTLIAYRKSTPIALKKHFPKTNSKLQNLSKMGD